MLLSPNRIASGNEYRNALSIACAKSNLNIIKTLLPYTNADIVRTIYRDDYRYETKGIHGEIANLLKTRLEQEELK